MILGPPPEGRGLSHSRTRIIINTFTKLSTRAVIVVVFDTEKIPDQIEKEITVSSFLVSSMRVLFNFLITFQPER